MKNILLFTLLLCCVTLRSQTYSIYPIPQKTTMNGNSIEMTREVNLIKEPGINEMISNRIQEVREDIALGLEAESLVHEPR